jgi:hypothetical protein
VEIVRQYAPDQKLVVQALRRLLREPNWVAGETVPLRVPIRSRADRAPGVEHALERE